MLPFLTFEFIRDLSSEKNGVSLLSDAFADIRWSWTRRMKPPACIGARPPSGSSKTVRDQVLKSEEVQNAIRESMAEKRWSAGHAQSEAQRLFSDMLSEVSSANVRVFAYVMRKLWRQMYEAIRVNEDGLAMLKALTKQNTPVILLPMHKSHVDYLLVTYVLYAHHLFPPMIIAGDNLNIPLVGPVLRRSGAVFIRRAFANDKLYTAIFNQYIAVLLQAGFSMECFIEGTRSRSGKLKNPKTGFLKVLVDLMGSGRLRRDLMLVPVAISYDQVIEGAAFVNEMLGEKKQKESLMGLLNAANQVLRLNFGSIDVHFCQPISLVKLMYTVQPYMAPAVVPVSERDSAAGTETAADRTAEPPEQFEAFNALSEKERRRFVLGVAHRVMYEMNLCGTTTATSIVCTILLTTPQRGIHIDQVIARTEWLRRQVVLRGGRVAHLFETESTADVVNRALTVVANLVKRENSIIYGYKQSESLQLTFYRNQLIHIFVSECLIAVALAAEFNDDPRLKELPRGVATVMAVEKSRLLRSVRFVSQLLKLEFVYKPAPDFEDNFQRTIEKMTQRGILRVVAGSSGVDLVCVDSGQEGKDTFYFLLMLIFPFLDVAWVSCLSLVALAPNHIMEEGKLAQIAARRAQALYYSGDVDFYEAVSVESILNMFQWCANQRIVEILAVSAKSPAEVRSVARPGARVVRLLPPFDTGPVQSGSSASDGAASPVATSDLQRRLAKRNILNRFRPKPASSSQTSTGSDPSARSVPTRPRPPPRLPIEPTTPSQLPLPMPTLGAGMQRTDADHAVSELSVFHTNAVPLPVLSPNVLSPLSEHSKRRYVEMNVRNSASPNSNRTEQRHQKVPSGIAQEAESAENARISAELHHQQHSGRGVLTPDDMDKLILVHTPSVSEADDDGEVASIAAPPTQIQGMGGLRQLVNVIARYRMSRRETMAAQLLSTKAPNDGSELLDPDAPRARL